MSNDSSIFEKVTKKSFKFAQQHGLPFYFVSAADGMNVVKIFEEAIKVGAVDVRGGRISFDFGFHVRFTWKILTKSPKSPRRFDHKYVYLKQL